MQWENLPVKPIFAYFFWSYSVGRCEGDTLVVEIAGFNDKTARDLRGHRHSEALRITERLRADEL